ncbi:hypothetical protein SADUNF_Sadunf15G0044800 [Salix dunnii]|uniref:Uncharacterized protein n=1 Tax=Salix dunnii TaxID=1413687 RepID=A0A835MJ00_9ROSI|nr:hypothetical protein SADUNF_Sadunf15G0044800 [Salix dunnii]
MEPLDNKILLLLGRRNFKPMFAYLEAIVVSLLPYIVLPEERSWVQSMFSGDPSRAKAFGRARKGTSDGTSALNENGTPRQQDSSAAGQKKFQTNVRILRGHSGVIIALHCVTRREVWDLVGDRKDAEHPSFLKSIMAMMHSGGYRVDPPTPYMMGLHSSIDTPCSRWCKANIQSICIFFCNCSTFLSLQIKQLLNSHGFLDYWEREVLVMMKTIIIVMTSYKTQLEGVRIPFQFFPLRWIRHQITYDRFLSSIRSKEQEERRKQILVTTSGAFVYRNSKELCILIDVLFTGFAALIESNAERIGGNGFIDGWHCELTDEQFVAVKQLHHLISLSLWEELRYSLLTLASNAICHLIYPFRWQVNCNYLEVYCSFIKLEYHF